MLLHDARRDARVGPAGELVLLDDQDRARWDAARIAEGQALVEAALGERRPGPYQLQAAIAALHDEASTAADTDWPQIAALYGALQRMTPSPVVELNLAAAVAMADGPAVGLAMMDGHRGHGRAREVSVPPLRARRPAAPARALVRGRGRLPARPRADDERARTRLPRGASRDGRGTGGRRAGASSRTRLTAARSRLTAPPIRRARPRTPRETARRRACPW